MIRTKATTPATTRAARTTTAPSDNQVSAEKKKPMSAPRDGSRARQSISRSDKEAPTTAPPAKKKAEATPSVSARGKPSPPNNNQLEKASAPPRKRPMNSPRGPNVTLTASLAAVKMHGLPSASLNKHKQADPWSTKKKSKTNFGSSYQAGNIPCRINHGGIKNSLQWNTPPEELDYNPLLVTCCEGFLETDHPFVFLARQGFQDLMGANGADDKVRPLLGLLIPPIRGALMASSDDVITVALNAIQLVSEAVGGDMNVHLAKLIQQVHRKYTNKALKGPIDQTLAALERNGGTEALRIIRTKIPTYVSLA